MFKKKRILYSANPTVLAVWGTLVKSREEKKSHNYIIFDISLHVFIYSVFPYVNDLQDASPPPPALFF